MNPHNDLPVMVNPDAWCFEDPKGLTVVQRVRDTHGAYLRTVQVLIPWATLRAAVQRKDQSERAKTLKKKA